MSKISSPSDDVTSPLHPEEGIAVVELADELQIRKQTIFKVMKRLGIQAVKRREYDRRGQMPSSIKQQFRRSKLSRRFLRRVATAEFSRGFQPTETVAIVPASRSDA